LVDIIQRSKLNGIVLQIKADIKVLDIVLLNTSIGKDAHLDEPLLLKCEGSSIPNSMLCIGKRERKYKAKTTRRYCSSKAKRNKV
jgi:hypothetical protein